MVNYRQRIYDRYVSVQTFRSFSFCSHEYRYFVEEFDMNYGRFLPEDKNAKILELGCGPGFFIYFLEKKGFNNITGIDISLQQIDIAKGVVKGNLILGNFFDFLNQNNEKHDLIIARHIVEHLKKEEIIELLDKVNFCLDQGGRFIVEVPNASSPIFGMHVRYKDFTHEVSFTIESLEQVLMATNFKILHSGPYKAKPLWKRFIYSMFNKAVQPLINEIIFFDKLIFSVAEKPQKK